MAAKIFSVLPIPFYYGNGNVVHSTGVKDRRRLRNVKKSRAVLLDKSLDLVYNKNCNNLQTWFSGRTSASQADGAGSIPVVCSKQNDEGFIPSSFCFDHAMRLSTRTSRMRQHSCCAVP